MEWYIAAQIGDWDMVERELAYEKGAFLVRIGPYEESPLHITVAAATVLCLSWFK